MAINVCEVFEYNQHFVAMMNVINAARLNPPESGHKHHIVPRCWFKMNNLSVDNSKDNLVFLSVEDHIKVHKLALLCAKDKIMNSKLAWALKRVSNGTFLGCHHTKESKEKNKIAHLGKHHDEETRKKMSEAVKGDNNSFYGKHHTDETRRKISNSRKGKCKGMSWKIVEGHRVWYKKEVL